MEIIQKLSVKARLGLILGFMAIFGVVMAAFSIQKIGEISELTSQMHDHPFKVSNAAITANLYIEKNRRLIKEIILSDDSSLLVNGKISVEDNQKIIADNLDIIHDNISGQEGINLEKETGILFDEWLGIWQEEWFLKSGGESSDAEKMYNNQGKTKVSELEAKMEQLMNYAVQSADRFWADAKSSQTKSTYLLILFFLSGTVAFSVMTVLITRSILKSIFSLKQTMNESVKDGKLSEAEIIGKNEIADMAADFNSLVRVLQRNAWITEGKNSLRMAIADIMQVNDFIDRALGFIARYTGAGSAVFYLYDEEKKVLSLVGSYAYTERDFLQNECKPGEGIVGQVAKEMKPILLKNVKRSEAVIASGIVSIQPLSVYAFPLHNNNTLLGVIEVLFANEITNRYTEILDEFGRIASTALSNNLQNEQIRTLLDAAEKAKIELGEQAEELQGSNTRLEEQQQVLNQQAEELQQANVQMEEQQHELQLMNMHLEEQKDAVLKQNLALEEKNRQMDMVNRELDIRSCELEDANKYKSELLANMSHELRTPLNSIILLSRLLSAKEDNVFGEKEIEKAKVIHKSGVELLRLIDDILDLSKIEAGKVQMSETEFNTSILISEWEELFREIAAEKKLAFNVVDNIRSELYGDRDKISQIIRNFLSNAFKFTGEGSIEVTLDKNDDTSHPFKMSVKDTGIGIPEEKQQIIFEAFSQANTSITREFGGTGLGLSICRELAKLMGAEIRLESTEGRGSEFVLLLPSGAVVPGNGDAAESLPSIAKSIVNIPDDDSGSIRKSDKVILIIEDDADFAKVIMGVARELGFKVIFAPTGQKGLELARKFMPMGVLLDLMLPDMNGTRLLSALKSEKGLSNIPVHIISGTGQENSLRKLGAAGFMSKPISPEDIKEALNKIVRSSLNIDKQILLIEDDEAQSMAIAQLLQSEDIKVNIVQDEDEGCRELAKGGYDAVVLDLMLRNGSGLNLCKYIAEKYGNTPVVVYTARSLTFEQERELKKYSDSIILKTAGSHERLIDEVRLFLHKVKEDGKEIPSIRDRQLESQIRELKGKRILIADDDAKNVFVMAAALEKLEIEVVNAHNGKEAVEKLRNEKIDLVLMDIMMPLMDGYEATRLIKDDEKLKYIPVIALTAKALRGDREKALEAGADDYISKPVDYDILVRLINAWISKKKQG